jgi:hypothetical protein
VESGGGRGLESGGVGGLESGRGRKGGLESSCNSSSVQ